MNKNEISNVLFVISARISLTDTPDLEGRKEGNALFNDTLNTFYLRLERESVLFYLHG